MKTRMVRRATKRTPRVVYFSGEPEIKSNIEFSENLFTGRQIYYTWNKRYKRYVATNRTPVCSNGATGQMRRYFYIMWFLRNRDIGYMYYDGSERTWEEVVKDRVGNCCDLSVLVNVLAGQTGMATDCGTPITTRAYVKDKIYQNGSTFYHIYNLLKVNGKYLVLDATNYVTTGNILPLGIKYNLKDGVYTNAYNILSDKNNPVTTIPSTDDPCP